MKLRNQLLALFCLLVFLGVGFLYFHEWVRQKPFGIILFLGDGLVAGNLTAARLYEGGADHKLTLESLPYLALLSNQAGDFAVPDSPAAASAIATGVKVNNRSVSMSPRGTPLKTIIELAQASGRAVGVVTNSSLTDAGIAAFYAHASKSDEIENIAAQFADSTRLDVALGGGAHDFTPEANGGGRKDGRDLLTEMKQAGREIFRSKADLENAPIFTAAQRVGIFATGNLPYSTEIQSGSQQPSLPDMVRRAIQFLQMNPKGYLLVVDAALISRAAEQNDGEHTITETVEFDHAIATALKYSGGNTLLLAVGKSGIGGMTLNGYPLRQDHGVGLLGINPFGYPAISWSSGPNGAVAKVSPDSATKEPAAVYAPAALNFAEDVIGVGIGPGARDLKAFMDNTAIFQIIKNNL